MRTSLRPATALAALALVAGGCASGEDADVASARMTTATRQAASPVAAEIPTVPPADPPTTGALPGAAMAPRPAAAPELPETVAVRRPALLVRSEPAALETVREARGVAGIAAMSGASTFEARIRGIEGEETLTAAAVDPEGFRPLTPDVTAQTVGVWERMLDGEIVLRHDVAHRLGVRLGDLVAVAGPRATEEVRVGAFASNGAPPIADLLVPWELGRRLGAPGVNLVVAAVSDDADAGDVGAGIARALGGGEVVLHDAPERREARVVGTSVEFEPFSYTDLGDGMIVIDPAWVGRWIVPVDLPRVGATRVHRIMAPQLLAAFDEIRAAGLLEHFKPEQFGGGWVPRHIDWDPTKPLSMHAWGLAIDLNTHDNWLGQAPRMDRRIVEIFERWGFAWGGHWQRPDGMHFELARVVTVEG